MKLGDEVYLRLAEFLDKLPAGYPTTPDGLEIDILKHLFSPEEAEMAAHMRLFAEPPRVIAGRIGLAEEEVAERLEEMARKGLVLSVESGGKPHYMASQFVIGIHEFQVDRIDREHVDLIKPYLPYFKDEMTPMKQFRVVPVNSAIDTKSAVAPHERVKELVRGQDSAAVADCICRKGKSLNNEVCEKPLESCLVFSYAADYYLRYGKAREITIDDALGIIERADETGLVLMATHAKDIVNICCCCGCCCDALKLLKMAQRPVEHLYSEFQAKLTGPGDCTLCQACLERCQMEALVERDGAMRVEPDRCIGCGLCVSTCEGGALALHPVYAPENLPANQFHMLSEIAKERGKGFGALSPMMKRAKAKPFLMSLNMLYKSGAGKPLANFMSRRGWI